MTKRKQPKPAAAAPAAKRPKPAVETAVEASAPVVELAPERRFSIREYVLLNVIFDAFCLLQLLLVRVFLSETRGLYFFFALLMIGFLLVSVFDYFYDRMAPGDEPVA